MSTIEEIKSNPTMGVEVKMDLNDPRLTSDCAKMAKYYKTSEGSFEIHYVLDKAKNIFFDFKFK